jgi:hypothetical protein
MGLRAGWLALFVFVWIIGAFLGSTYEYQNTPETWAGTGSGGYYKSPITTLEYLFDVSNAVQVNQILGAIPVPMPNKEYFSTAFKVATWRWSFLDGYEMFYWIFCAPFAIMGIMSLSLLAYGVMTGNLTFS